jgi:uncharacterized protein YdgA (DUF945 family)
MKKVITGVVFILIIAGVCLPFVNGLVMEKIVKNAQKDFNQMSADNGSGVTLGINEYDRRFSSTEIEWSINLGRLSTIYGVDEIIFVERAEHGYTRVVSTTSLEKNQWFVDVLNNHFAGKNPLTITTRYKPTGKIESTIDLAAFALQLANETVESQPAKIVTECSEGLRHCLSNGSWAGLSVPDKFRIADISLAADLEKVSTYLWAGNIAYTIGKINLSGQGRNFAATNFKIAYLFDFDKKKNTLSAGLGVKLDNLVTDDKQVKDMSCRFETNNIDAVGYQEFMKVYTETIYSTMDDIGAAKEDPEKLKMVLQKQMVGKGLQLIAAYEKLLKKGLEFKIADLHAQLPEGKISGNLELRLNRNTTFAQLAPIARQPRLAFELFSLQTYLSFPAELARGNTKFVSPIYPGMQTGLFVAEGKNLVHRTQTRNGKLLLNGKEVKFN